jgi:hypothetical protein
MFFKPFVKKLRWNLDGQNIAFVAEWSYRFEPGVEVLFVDMLPDDFKTIVPGCGRINFHAIADKSSEFFCSRKGKGDKGVEKLMNKKQIYLMIFFNCSKGNFCESESIFTKPRPKIFR